MGGCPYSKGIWLGQYSTCSLHHEGGWVRTRACEGERRQVRVKEGSVQTRKEPELAPCSKGFYGHHSGQVQVRILR